MRSQPLVDASIELMARGTFYPLTVYPWHLQALLTFVLPLGFIGFYPPATSSARARTLLCPSM